MRNTRRLLLLALVVAAAAVAVAYRMQTRQQAGQAPQIPKPLATNIQAAGKDWVYFKGDGNRPIVEIRARDMERVEGPPASIQLRQVELRLFHKDGKQFDRVVSGSATFDESGGSMYADGDVEITLAVPAEEEPKGRLLTIRSSGVRFDAKDGKATTDRHTSFSFDLGEGEAVGASYDPSQRELQLHHDVKLTWRGRDPKRPPMHIDAEQLVYKESESKVYLGQRSRLRRETLTMDGGDTIVSLDDGAIRRVEAQRAQGLDRQASRQLKFSADFLVMDLSPRSEIQRIEGNGSAKLESSNASAITRIGTDRIELDFDVVDRESVLRTATAHERGVMESRPVARPGSVTPATRVLRSDSIVTKMRPGGEEIEVIETHAPGVFELIPNAAGQPRRRLNGSRMWITYGAQNRLQSFRAAEVSTRTDKPAVAGRPAPPPAVTTSNDLQAEFDPQTGEMRKMEQWINFRYQEGDQQATAEHATLENPANRITLAGKARSWDPTGSVSADRIVLEQSSDRLTAEGGVNSTRQPDKKASNGMLSAEEAMYAKADRMVTTNRNRRISYEGRAVLWQGANRLQGDSIHIDRTAQTVTADGNVISQVVDQNAKKGSPLTLVRSQQMRYSDTDRLAHYRGSVRLTREGMDVRARELRAFLKEQPKDGESRIEKAFADGDAVIVQEAKGRLRRGSADHAEYYVAEEKVILKGGHPSMVDSVKGTTRGLQLTYFANNDSLQVEGADSQPAASRILRK